MGERAESRQCATCHIESMSRNGKIRLAELEAKAKAYDEGRRIEDEII